MKYNTVLFDLDGTLTDPKEGITRSFAYALKQYGIEEDPDNLTKVIGPPLYDSFIDFYGFTREESEKAVWKYREFFSTKGIFENTVYDGIPGLLKTLKEHGFKIAVASSKPTVYVKRILEHFGIEQYFDAVVGSELDGSRIEKPDIITEAVRQLGSEPGRTVMVGDRKYDVIGAGEFGIDSIGVSWGYAFPGELDCASAVADTVEELKELLIS